MRSKDFSGFTCPVTGERLSVEMDPETGEAHLLKSASGRIYSVKDGLPILIDNVDAAINSSMVRENRDYYRAVAKEYDAGINWLFKSFYADQQKVRDELIDQLRIDPGDQVLETGCGTGLNILNLSQRTGKAGRVYATDLSSEMLQLSVQRIESDDKFGKNNADIVLFLSDATALPFPDNRFDVAFHFGGLNLFGDRRKGIAEMTRVVKPGGKVLFGDEGVAPWLRTTEFAEILFNSNPYYRHTAPIELLPIEADHVCLRWILGGAFYVVDFVVREGPPKLHLDLPIPGHRGGSHRTRYFGKLEGIDPNVRDRARDAARAAGVSFQEWLERLIRSNISD